MIHKPDYNGEGQQKKPRRDLPAWSTCVFHVLNLSLLIVTALALSPASRAQGQLSLNTTAGWHVIQNSELKGADNTSPCPPDNATSPNNPFPNGYASFCGAVMNRWNSAIYDAARNRLIIWGGGHADYGGNEVYGVNLSAVGTSNPAIIRLDNPANPPNTLPVGTGGCAESVGPGGSQPNSRHTYDQLQYLGPVHDKMWVFGGSLNNCGNPGNGMWELSLSSVTGACAPNCAPAWTQIATTAPATLGGGSAYDPINDLVYFTTEAQGSINALWQYNPNTHASTQLNNGFSIGIHGVGSYDPLRQTFIMVGNIGVSGGLASFNMATGNAHNLVVQSTTGCPDFSGIGYPGVQWDPVDKRFVVYPNSGNQLYILNAATWTCTTETYGSVQGTDFPQPSADTSGGLATFKHFNYDPGADVYVLCNDPSAKCWYLRRRTASMDLQNTSGSTVTNIPVGPFGRPFRQGDIATCPQPYLNGTAVSSYQADVKNRWPDGSVQFAVMSFLLPSLANSASTEITYGNSGSCNNTGFLTKTDLLAAGFNFDAQIQLSGGTNPIVSARAILNACSSIVDPGTDPSAPQSQPCRYWLKGPIVTSVIFEDRSTARAFDIDNGSGAKNLHPIFECEFWPQTNNVHCGYTLENAWISSTATNDVRDTTYGFTLTGGNTAPVSLFTQASFTQIGLSRWHRQFCINGVGYNWDNQCGPRLHIDRNLAYLEATKAVPNYDPMVIPTSTVLAGSAGTFSAGTKTIPGDKTPTGNCDAVGGIGSYCKTLGSAGNADWIGPDELWSILYLYSGNDGTTNNLYDAMVGNADLSGWFPFHNREQDASAGSGQHFDAPTTGTVGTNGRVFSVNARQATDISDFTWNPVNCGGSFASDRILAGAFSTDGIGQGGESNDASHKPAFSYTAYLITGKYYYLEELQMNAAYLLGFGQGCAAPGTGSIANRQLSWGIVNLSGNIGGPRGPAWWYRTVGAAAFISPSGSPEKAYFEDKLKRSIAEDEGAHGTALFSNAYQTYYNWGVANRQPPGNGNQANAPNMGISPLGYYWSGNPGTRDGGNLGTDAANATKWWMENFLVVALGMVRDFGYPADNILSFLAKRTNGLALDPTASPFWSQHYSVATTTFSSPSVWIPTWAATGALFNSPATQWNVAIGYQVDHQWDNGYQAMARGAASFVYPYTDANGRSGATAWNNVYGPMPVVFSGNNLWATQSPKFSMIPRTAIVNVASGTVPAVGNCNESLTTSGLLGVSAAKKACKP